MAIIRNIRTLKDATILAERKANSAGLDFLRYNLIYGFNGSGKSTLSRILSCLEKSKRHHRLPDDCIFEIEMDDGTIHGCPDTLIGLTNRVCVFNNDFIEENLKWSEGIANPIFYIGREQAELAEKLKESEGQIPELRAKSTGAEKLADSKSTVLANYKRDRAKAIADRLREGNRRYEANHLAEDYRKIKYEVASILTPKELDAKAAICAQAVGGVAIKTIEFKDLDIEQLITTARDLAGRTLGAMMAADLERHPKMVAWVKAGHEYHHENRLDSCLYCGNVVPKDRQALLEKIFDNQLQNFLDGLRVAVEQVTVFQKAFESTLIVLPDSGALSPELAEMFSSARAALDAPVRENLTLLEGARNMLFTKQEVPTLEAKDQLPAASVVTENVAALRSAVGALNDIFALHNQAVADFAAHQADARLSIKKHYLAEGEADYVAAVDASAKGKSDAATARSDLELLEKMVEELRAKVQTHGPATTDINNLVKSYLGHGELTVAVATEGYELHRHGKLVKGPPSEGEKTAIALCYFLSTLRANGRSLKDLIVVVDDPVSSLDTRAMNFACAMIRLHLEEAAQLFVLTHNQHCMNEFKKPWKNRAKEDDPKRCVRLFFIDVKKPTAGNSRVSSLVTMSKLLREHDSEYHFLFQKVLQFEADGLNSEYAFMMPNVIRRVLDVFLAFRVPKSGNNQDKLKALCKDHPALDIKRLIALDRLSQVESHSDSLDDLIAHSSMTIEESHDANNALLHLMETTDGPHLGTLRSYCKVAP